MEEKIIKCDDISDISDIVLTTFKEKIEKLAKEIVEETASIAKKEYGIRFWKKNVHGGWVRTKASCILFRDIDFQIENDLGLQIAFETMKIGRDEIK